MALLSHEADSTSEGVAAFTFLSTPDDALLATERPDGPHASILGKTITARIKVDSHGATFHYYGEGACGTTPATVRLYFNTNGAFGFGNNTAWYGHYWWSNPVAAYALADGTVTLTAQVTAANWSDWGGELATAVPDEFAAAASNPDLIGFSFGGGCFFENGVGATGGDATFTVMSLDIGE